MFFLSSTFGSQVGIDARARLQINRGHKTLVVVAAAGRAGGNRTGPTGEPHQFGGASSADSVGTQGSHAEAPTPGPIGGTDSSLPGLWKMEKRARH